MGRSIVSYGSIQLLERTILIQFWAVMAIEERFKQKLSYVSGCKLVIHQLLDFPILAGGWSIASILIDDVSCIMYVVQKIGL